MHDATRRPGTTQPGAVAAPASGPAGAGTPLLVLQDVVKSYGRGPTQVRVLDEVSLVVHPGETVWLRGSSGSGKSSLLRIAGLLSTPDSGRVVLAGEPARSAGAAADVRRERVGFVFQHSNLLPDLTTLANLAVAARDRSTDELLGRLAAVGLAERGDRLAKTLSGGEAQRVAFCRALLNDPDLLLVDEPTAGLDPANAAVVRDQLLAARARGRAILVASHDAATAEVADRVVDMAGGRLV